VKVSTVPIGKVKPYAGNPRRNADAVAKVAASLKEFGWRQPIVVDGKGVVVVGHTRLLAASSLGMAQVPVHVAEGLTAAQVRAYRLADNRTNEEAEWDEEPLAAELRLLEGEGYDLGLTGFDTDELADLLAREAADLDAEEPPPLPARPTTKTGDLIRLGGHTLVCADAGRPEAVALAMASKQADALAAEFAVRGRREESEAGTVAQLFDSYEREVTPGKSRHAQQHDRTTAALFLACVGRSRPVVSLNRRDWDKYMRDRRAGVLRPAGKKATHRVRDRQVQYDLQTIRAVLNWGTQVNDRHGRPLVDRHPFRGLELPREESPRRPRLSDADYRAMLTAAEAINLQFQLALVLAHETGHRIGGIRMLRWSDVDLKASRIRWRAENDKIGFEHTTALTSDAVAALDTARTRQVGIGDAWVFPAATQRGQPTGRMMFRHWWDLAEVAAELEPVERRGWHSLRRSFATELKHAPLTDLAYLGGWKSVATVVAVYQQPDDATMLEALASRRTLEAARGG
jgi:ParB-like chromosome segregation protein Spo0J/integrase